MAAPLLRSVLVLPAILGLLVPCPALAQGAPAPSSEPTAPPSEPSDAAPESTDEPAAPDSGLAEPEPTLPPAPVAPEPPPAAPPPEALSEETPPEKTTEPAEAPGERGRVSVGLRATLVAPFGQVSSDVSHLDRAGLALGLGGDLGFGVAHDVAVGAYGWLGLDSAAPSCTTCSPLSYGAGLFARYHLVQGLRFDPWVSYGIGVIGLAQASPRGDYFGLEWLRLTFGGEWSATRTIGFGPLLELGAGNFWQVPSNESPGGVHFRFQVGLRVALRFPGR